jgi:hypothetical protein
MVRTLSAFLFAFVLLGATFNANAQRGKMNLAAFDTKSYHFGFLLSGNQAGFDYSISASAADSVYGIYAQPAAGFNLALLAAWHINTNLSLRFLPGLSFQDRGLTYQFNEGEERIEVIRRTESVFLDFPLLLKIRTNRIGNFAAYGVVGGKISRDMQSQEDVNQQLSDDFILRIGSVNRSIDIGAGVDIFLPFFKLGIEGKFELGTRDVLIQDESTFSSPLNFLRTRAFILSICFEG